MKNILLIFLVALTLQSCNVGTSSSLKNERIHKEKREEIKILNDKLFKGIMNNDITGVKALMADKLIEKDGSEIEKSIKYINSSFKSGSYKILDEYYVTNSTTGLNNTLVSDVSGDNGYVLNYQAMNDDMYVSLLLPTGINNDLLITVIYGKYNDQWKINILQFGQYSLFKKTAPDYYKLAQESYRRSYLIDAVNYITLANQCLNPANEIFKYKKEKEITDFYAKLIKEANTKYTLPMTIENIDTKPKIFRIFPQITNEGFFPMVYYLSSIDLKDTKALKNENEKVKIEVSKLFKGIDKDKKNVFYAAFNEIPDGKKSIDHYGFVDKLKE